MVLKNLIYRYKDTVCVEMAEATQQKYQYGPPTHRVAAWAKVFEDLMWTGGRGSPGYACGDLDVRMPRLVQLHSLKILTNGRIPCQTGEKSQDFLKDCVELKVMEEANYEPGFSAKSFERYKAKRFAAIWAQCVPVGIETVYLGTRTSEGSLTEIKKLTMEEMARECSRFWQPETMLNFLNKIFTWLKSCTTNGVTYTLVNEGRGWLILETAEHEDMARNVRNSFPEE